MNIITRIESIREREHEATVELVAALVECDRTEAHLEFGYSGIWDLLARHLHYSNAAASRRYKAMKCARAHPEVLPMLRKHEVNLSTLAMVEATLAKTEEPKALLRAISGKSQREVERVLARRNPLPPRKETVRRHGVKPVAAVSGLFTSAAEASVVPVAEESPTARTSAAEAAERVHLSFSVSADTFEDLERAKEILSRKLPKGVTLEQALEELLGFFLQRKEPKARKKPTKESTSRHIPAAVRDEVYLRDGGRCTYTGPTGQRCGIRHDVEVDHIRPFALGGKHDVENLRVLCATHNRFRARRTFGEAHVKREPLPQRN